MLLLLNVLRPPPQRVANIESSVWMDLGVGALFFGFYGGVVALHKWRFHQHIYPFLKKVRGLPIYAGCYLFTVGVNLGICAFLKEIVMTQ